MPISSSSSAHRGRGTSSVLGRAVAVLVTGVMLVGFAPAPGASAAITRSGTLTLATSGSAAQRIGGKRTTALVETTFTVPASTPVDVAIQFRARRLSSGYRALLTLAGDGTVVAKFTRVRSGRQTTRGAALALGLDVQPGDKIHLEATVAAKRTVKLYLRAWKDGDAKPEHWQLKATDSTSKRIKTSGYNYVWAQASASTAPTSVDFSADTVQSFSASRAAAIGMEQPASSEVAAGGGTPFTVAVMPDTQDETLNASNPKFANRTQWLVDNRAALNLEYVMHSGDVVDWGWLVPSQFDVAKTAIRKLSDAGIPYALTIGNHDTAAVGWNGVAGSTGYGGSAYASNPECPTRLGAAQCSSPLLVRNTAAFNAAFPLSSMRNVGGTFEAGKVDNMWTSFTDEASGTKWMVLTLELWPRKEAVAWAANVVAGHPDYNVLVQTHSYLTSSGSIEQSNGGYGSTSGQYLFDNLIKKYANIKLVFSGHVGNAAKRIDTGVNGNKIVSYLECFHSGSTNPVRLVTIDPSSGTVSTKVYAPLTNETWTQYSTSDTIKLVR